MKENRKIQKKETKRFFLNLPWSTSIPLAAMVAAPLSILAYSHPEQFAAMVKGVAEAKWGGQFWAGIAVVLFVLLACSVVSAQAERTSRREYISRLEEEISRRKNALEKGEQE